MPCPYRTGHPHRRFGPRRVLERRLTGPTFGWCALAGELFNALLRAREALPTRRDQRLALLEQPDGLLQTDVAALKARDHLIQSRQCLLKRRLLIGCVTHECVSLTCTSARPSRTSSSRSAPVGMSPTDTIGRRVLGSRTIA